MKEKTQSTRLGSSSASRFFGGKAVGSAYLLLAAFAITLPLLIGWPSRAGASEPYAQLVPGEDYPSAGPGFAFFDDSRCSPAPRNVYSDCYAVGTEYPGVPVYVYAPDSTCGSPPATCGAQYNPDLIAGYALILQDCCRDTGKCCLEGEDENTCTTDERARRQEEHCSFLEDQLWYFGHERRSPHKGLDLWPYRSNGFADGMAQSKIAKLYLREYSRSCDAGACNRSFVTTALRATKAFDWWCGNGGVAYAYDRTHYWYVHNHVDFDDPGAQGIILNGHNFALIHLYDIWETWNYCANNRRDCPTPNPFTAADAAAIRMRLERGLAALRDTKTPLRASVDDFSYHVPGTIHFRSYYRTTNTGEPIGQPMDCDDNYHEKNYQTLNRLVDRGLDYTGVLRRWALRWQYMCGY